MSDKVTREEMLEELDRCWVIPLEKGAAVKDLWESSGFKAREAIRALIREHGPEVERPKIVCLCGSTRFMNAFRRASLEETLGRKIVLSIGCNLRDSDFETFTQEHLAEIKVELDELHLRKIDLADEVLILNVGGYIGESTRNELNYAKEKGKKIRFLELPDVYPTLR